MALLVILICPELGSAVILKLAPGSQTTCFPAKDALLQPVAYELLRAEAWSAGRQIL